MGIEAAGFWSYAHDDDAAEEGYILRLAKRLQNAYSVLTGDDLRIFVDRADILWGDEWRMRIDNALTDTTFFIPIVTPRYLKRPECRRELIEFVGQAQSLGVDELVLPILYSPVADLSSDSSDEVAALIARTQYADWSGLRLKDPAGPEYRQAIHALAERLVEVAREVGERQVSRELAVDAPVDDDDDLSDLLSRISELLPSWSEAVLSDQIVNAQHVATSEANFQRLQKLRRSHAQPGAILAQMQRYVAAEMPLAEQYLSNAETYATKSVELNPLVTAAIRIVRAAPGSRSWLQEFESALGEAMENIHHSAPRTESMANYARRNAHISRAVRKMGDLFEKGDTLVEEANSIVEGWHHALTDLDKETSGGDS